MREKTLRSRPLGTACAESDSARNTCALCWEGKPVRVRTLKTKFGVSWRRLARVNVAVFLVLMMLVHWPYSKVNSRREVLFR